MPEAHLPAAVLQVPGVGRVAGHEGRAPLPEVHNRQEGLMSQERPRRSSRLHRLHDQRAVQKALPEAVGEGTGKRKMFTD